MGLERCMPLCLAIRLDIALDISTPGAPGKKKINTCVRHTPAGAGNTSAHMPGCVSIWTHPRLHGEYNRSLEKIVRICDSPPFTRGIHFASRDDTSSLVDLDTTYPLAQSLHVPTPRKHGHLA